MAEPESQNGIIEIHLPDELSSHTRDILSVFISESCDPRTAFHEVLEALVEGSFEKGYEGPSTLSRAVVHAIQDEHILQVPIRAFIEYAIDAAYKNRDINGGDLPLDHTVINEMLIDRLSGLGPKDLVVNVFKNLVNEGLNTGGHTLAPLCEGVSLEKTMEWALSPDVVRILEDHFVRLTWQYVPQIYAEKIRTNVVSYIQKMIKEYIYELTIEVNKDKDGNEIGRSEHFTIHKTSGLGELLWDLVQSGTFLPDQQDAVNEVIAHIGEALDCVRAQVEAVVSHNNYDCFFNIDSWKEDIRKIWDEIAVERVAVTDICSEDEFRIISDDLDTMRILGGKGIVYGIYKGPHGNYKIRLYIVESVPIDTEKVLKKNDPRRRPSIEGKRKPARRKEPKKIHSLKQIEIAECSIDEYVLRYEDSKIVELLTVKLFEPANDALQVYRKGAFIDPSTLKPVIESLRTFKDPEKSFVSRDEDFDEYSEEDPERIPRGRRKR